MPLIKILHLIFDFPQCEASTQAEIESDSDSLDESKASEPVSLNQVRHLQVCKNLSAN